MQNSYAEGGKYQYIEKAGLFFTHADMPLFTIVCREGRGLRIGQRGRLERVGACL